MQLRTSGHPLHTRSVTIVATEGAGGRVRVRGQLLDLRKTSFAPMIDDLQAAGIIHHMILDAEIDRASQVLERLETAQPNVAFEPSTNRRGESCRDPADRLQTLVGRRVDERLGRALLDVYGGPRGCSHLLALFQLVIAIVPPAFAREAELRAEHGEVRTPGEPLFRRTMMSDGTEVDDELLHLAIQLSDFHNTPRAVVRDRIELLAYGHEVRVLGTLALNGVTLTGLEAAERRRTHRTLAAGWEDCTGLVAPCAGYPILPGMGRRFAEALGRAPERQPLLDACRGLAPLFIQCTAALTDRFLNRGKSDSDAKTDGFMSTGGAVDSCYMWRGDGPLASLRQARQR